MGAFEVVESAICEPLSSGASNTSLCCLLDVADDHGCILQHGGPRPRNLNMTPVRALHDLSNTVKVSLN